MDPDGAALSRQVRENATRARDAALRGAKEGLEEVSIDARDRVRQLLDLPHSGPVYPGARAPASLPGEPPARQEGTLYRSYDSWVDDDGWPVRMTLFLATDDPKAPGLEFGTESVGGHVAPRPHVRKVAETVRSSATGILATHIERAQRRAL